MKIIAAPRREGFSLVEFMVVLVVLGLLVALAYPRLSTLATIYRLDGAARNLAIDLQKARGRAIAEGKCFRVVLDAGTKTYQVESFLPPCGTVISPNAEGGAKPISDSGSIGIEDPNNPGSAPTTPVFDSRGRGWTVSSIRLFDSNNSARMVFVQSTGRVYVQ
jgi:prepilin-type N-terminal cleavage/methylation domain-containing protein